MHYFPVCIDINSKKCVVIGGGRVAERKVASLLECGALVRVVSPDITQPLRDLQEIKRIEWLPREYCSEDIDDAFLVIAATDSSLVQDAVQADAARRNILINVADVPEKCNFILPATVRRGGLTLSVSTSGKSPALARKLRQSLEKEFGPEYELLVDLLGEIRPLILAGNGDQRENEILFRKLLSDELLDWIRLSDLERIEEYFSEVLSNRNLVLACLTKWKKRLKRPETLLLDSL